MDVMTWVYTFMGNVHYPPISPFSIHALAVYTMYRPLQQFNILGVDAHGGVDHTRVGRLPPPHGTVDGGMQ